MSYNKLLNRQINKFLPEAVKQQPEIAEFLKAINDSYCAFERDKILSDRAFDITEEEYKCINTTLKKEVGKRNSSINSLKEAISLINGTSLEYESDDLLEISNYIRHQVNIAAKATEQLRKQEALLYTTQEIAHIGTWEFDMVQNKVEWTDEIFKIRGLDKETTIPSHELFIAGIHKDDREFVLKNLDDINTRNISFNIHYRIVKPNGDIRFINDISYSVADENGRIIKVTGTFQDVTEQKKIEQVIQSQKRFTDDILNNFPSDIAVFDKDHRYLFVNPRAIKNKELREWIIGKTDYDYSDFKGIGYEMANKRREIFNQTIANKGGIEFIDEHLVDEKIYYTLRKFYPYFEEGELKFVIGYGIDITNQKQVELRLEDALDTMKKVNAELEQFAFVASHDLQEPLRMVTNFLSLFEKRYTDVIDEKGKQYIGFAVDGAKRMRQIILDLLVFSRAGKVETKLEEINLDLLIQEVSNMLLKFLEESKGNIHCKGLPTVKSYRTPLIQIFQNLISNSLKYRKATIVPEIWIEAINLNTHWQFSIRDNGIGIDPQYFDKIFVIFQRLHNKDEYSGTGIGLSVVKKIIESMDGTIWVESEEGAGATFYFTLSKKYIL